jgi:hypothetical protein
LRNGTSNSYRAPPASGRTDTFANTAGETSHPQHFKARLSGVILLHKKSLSGRIKLGNDLFREWINANNLLSEITTNRPSKCHAHCGQRELSP